MHFFVVLLAMKNYLFFFLIFFLFSNCKRDISGNWHATYKQGNHEFNYALDIEKKGIAYHTDLLVQAPLKGVYLPEEYQLNFPGTCGEGSFNYRVLGNTLYLENALGVNLTAKKTKCNRIDDYQTKLKIDFLRLRKLARDTVFNFKRGNNEYINIGYPKKDTTIKIETIYSNYDNEFTTIKSLDSLPNKISERYKDDVIPLINYILTPDKNIKANIFNDILDRLHKSGKKQIYIRTLKDSLTSKGRDIFEYIKLENGKFNFNTKQPLYKIIK